MVVLSAVRQGEAVAVRGRATAVRQAADRPTEEAVRSRATAGPSLGGGGEPWDLAHKEAAAQGQHHNKRQQSLI